MGRTVQTRMVTTGNTLDKVSSHRIFSTLLNNLAGTLISIRGEHADSYDFTQRKFCQQGNSEGAGTLTAPNFH